MGSEPAEFFFTQTRLAYDGAQGAVGNVARVQGHIGLPAIGMPQHDMRTGLAFHNETGALQFRQ